MNGYLIGNLLGRLLCSYAVVRFLLLLASRLDWRLALRRSARWHGALSVLVVFAAGLLAYVVRAHT